MLDIIQETIIKNTMYTHFQCVLSDKYLLQNTWEKNLTKWFMLDQCLRVWFILGGVMVAGAWDIWTPVSIVRKQRERLMLAIGSFLLLNQSRTSAHGMVPPMFRLCFLSWFKSFWKHPGNTFRRLYPRWF